MAERRGREGFDKDSPPFSRVFVIHGKGFTEAEFRTSFSQYGEVQDVWMVKNKYTGEEKGVTYIKFAKASEAAHAIEELNQRTIAEHPKPIKVVLANNRDEGSGRDPKEDLKMLRIFVIIPKSYTEDDLRNDFKEYGDIEYVSIVKDKRTGEAKGFGYVKYHRAYHAALALEKCPSHFKPKFADPKSSVPPVSTKRPLYDDAYGAMDRGDYRGYSRVAPARGRYDDYSEGYGAGYGASAAVGAGAAYGAGSYMDARDGRGRTYDELPGTMDRDLQTLAAILNRYGRPNGPCDVEAEMSTSNVSMLQLRRLFNLVPGLEGFEYTRSTGIAVMRYATPQLAAYACEQFNDFEYPIGYPIRMRLLVAGAGGADYRTPSRGGAGVNMESVIDQLQQMRGSDTSHLVQALKQVNSLLGQGQGQGNGTTAGAATSTSDLIDNRINADGTCSVRYCDIPLPPTKPLAPTDATSEERLFLVCQPRAIRVEILQDALCRFGNLIDVYLQPGKNFGYARYSEKSSAHRAVDVLHGQEVNGQRLKVIISDPPRSSTAASSSSGSRDEPPQKRVDTGERW